MTDLGYVSHYFGMEANVDLNKKTISLQHSIYLKIILGRYDMSNYKPAKIFISAKVANSLIPYKDQVEKSTVA